MLKLNNISKTYFTKQSQNNVLSDINISFAKSTVTTIFGNSGTGKTTLLNIAGLINSQDKGNITIDEMNINTSDNLSKIRLKYFGYIFQDNYLLPEFTVYENLILPKVIANKKLVNLSNEIDLLLDEFNLGNIKNNYPDNISMGEAQRVSILRSMVNSPKIIIADEPTSNLDEKNSLGVVNLFEKLQNNYEYTIIIATHDKSFLKISDNSYKLINKKLVKL